jgi:hypothetical protein
MEIFVCRMMFSPWAEGLDRSGAFGLNIENAALGYKEEKD